MPVTNAEVAAVFEEIADLLAIEGANQFRVRAYRDAAGTISRLSESVAGMVERDEDLSELRGVGEDLAEKVAAITEHDGHLEQLDEIRARNTGGTIEATVTRLVEEKGIEEIYLGISHNLCAAQALQRLTELHGEFHLRQVVVTDSVPQTESFKALPFLAVRSLAAFFARAIHRIHHNRSVEEALDPGAAGGELPNRSGG